MGSKRARKSCGGVERKLRSTMPILSSTCEDLKTTCRDDRIYVPGPKIHVRSQRNRRSASGGTSRGARETCSAASRLFLCALGGLPCIALRKGAVWPCRRTPTGGRSVVVECGASGIGWFSYLCNYNRCTNHLLTSKTTEICQR